MYSAVQSVYPSVANHSAFQYHLFFGSWTQDALQHPRTIGFANPAVLCYRNSALEVLLHLPVFVNMLKMHRVVCEVAGEDCLLCSMAEVSRLYWSSDLLTDEISQSVGKLWKLCMLNFWRPSLVDLKGHQDCAEFLMGFLTQVIKDWDEWAEENLIGYEFRDRLFKLLLTKIPVPERRIQSRTMSDICFRVSSDIVIHAPTAIILPFDLVNPKLLFWLRYHKTRKGNCPYTIAWTPI